MLQAQLADERADHKNTKRRLQRLQEKHAEDMKKAKEAMAEKEALSTTKDWYKHCGNETGIALALRCCASNLAARGLGLAMMTNISKESLHCCLLVARIPIGPRGWRANRTR